jgi:hypothetical protein
MQHSLALQVVMATIPSAVLKTRSIRSQQDEDLY